MSLRKIDNMIFNYNTWDIIGAVVGGLLVYCVGLVVYRLYIDPLSKFPGPKLAAATLWYEFYYEVIQKGQLTFKIREWHEQYGPIIRINPYEIHINDPTGEFYHAVFSGTHPRDKHSYYTSQFGTPESGFGTISHALHRRRRRALNPSFSKAAITRLFPVLQAKVQKLCKRIEGFKGTGNVVNMRLAFTCYTTDVITSYAFNRCWNHLDKEDWDPEWCGTLKDGAGMTRWTKQFPWMLGMMKLMPIWMVRIMDPGMILVFDVMKKIDIQIAEILSGLLTHEYEQSDSSLPSTLTSDPIPNRTIFHTLIANADPESGDKGNIDHLGQEGQNIIGAGADTTSNALTLITYYLLREGKEGRVLRKLMRELEEAMPDRNGEWDLNVAEGLPYLGGIIQEGLRLAYGISSRLTRLAPEEDLVFQDWVIPKNTPIGMSALLMHHNENIFPDSRTFLPERWTDAPDSGRSLDRYLVSFSKGSRMCIGINLARAELYLTLATLFRRYGDSIELFDTVYERDVELKHDFFLPQPSMESKGVRVLFK